MDDDRSRTDGPDRPRRSTTPFADGTGDERADRGHDTDARIALERARAAAAAGGRVAYEAFRTDLSVREKSGAMDAVTRADLDAQRRVIEVLEGGPLTDAVVAEEDDAPKTPPATGATWVVDPIDGTNNFARGNRVWATSVAYAVDEEPVVGVTVMPAVGDTYLAGPDGVRRNDRSARVSDRDDPEKFTVATVFGLAKRHRGIHAAVSRTIIERLGDLRRFGSAQAVLAMVACGELDAAVSTVELAPWDTMAGVELVRAAGGAVTDLDGERWRWDADGMIATNGRAHGAVLELLPDGRDYQPNGDP